MGWFNDLQRISASAENAARLLRSLGDFNVLDLLPGIAAPTLVLHCRDDAAVPFEQGRLIASRIPRAQVCRAREPQPRPVAARSGLGPLRQRGARISWLRGSAGSEARNETSLMQITYSALASMAITVAIVTIDAIVDSATAPETDASAFPERLAKT